MLVKHFTGLFNRLRGKSVKGISQEALSLLMFHEYPGNIRELENIIEHAFVLTRDEKIDAKCLPEHVASKRSTQIVEANMYKTMRLTEKQVIMEALKRNKYNRMAVARDLGIHKSTFYRKIKKLGLNLPEMDGRSIKKNLSVAKSGL